MVWMDGARQTGMEIMREETRILIPTFHRLIIITEVVPQLHTIPQLHLSPTRQFPQTKVYTLYPARITALVAVEMELTVTIRLHFSLLLGPVEVAEDQEEEVEAAEDCYEVITRFFNLSRLSRLLLLVRMRCHRL